MSAPSDPTERAVAIRDYLLPLIREHGAAQEISGPPVRMMVWKVGNFTFTLHSPANPWQVETSPAAAYSQALVRQRSKTPPAWGLDVWHGGKVLSLRWDNPNAVEVVSFTRRPWEDAALALS
jgi:hypothetical protein